MDRQIIETLLKDGWYNAGILQSHNNFDDKRNNYMHQKMNTYKRLIIYSICIGISKLVESAQMIGLFAPASLQMVK